MRGLGLLLFAALGLQGVAPGAALPHVEQYEVVTPRRLGVPRARRALPSRLGLYPESVSYVLGARGHTFTLHLRKNRDLVGSGYAETYTATNGSQVTERLQRQDHCFYQGRVEGHPHSAASLSTCAGLRGFFQAGPAVRLIEPLAGAGEEGPHALYLAQHLQQEAGTCGVDDSSLESVLGPRVSAALRPRWSEPRETRYVELFVVTDSTEFQRFGSREAMRQRVLEVVNHVDKLYQELNFRVVLVGLEMWNGGDKIQVSSQPDATLDNFLAWRTRELVGRQAHDNVQLITGVDFTGTTVGLAKVSTMCSQNSGAVNQDHSLNPIGVASTMAHEMGHNLGLDHDENVAGCYCPVPREGGGCVMAASIGSQYPRKFSHCSRADLETFLEKRRTACLVDTPDLDRLVGGPVCGNGFLERGEQCDCGRPEDCQNRCCNASTCLLAEGAECAHGACCHECRVKPAGELCRPAKDQCDLGEHCDGRRPACPEDAFRENGTPCPEGYCYNGACPTPAKRCQDLWGPGSRVAVETCFRYSISEGCGAGIPLQSGMVNKCGTLFCEGGQDPPEGRHCILTTPSGTCRAVVQDGSTAYEPVPKGTKCGEEQVCWDGFCRGLHVYRSRNCSAWCNSHGECDHKDRCHCFPGWAPPHCAELLSDPHAAPGSRRTRVLVGVGALVVLVLILAGVLIYRKARSPVRRRNVAPKTAMGLSNPLFHEGLSKPAKGGAQAPPGASPEPAPPSQPPKPTASSVTPKRPPPAPPGSLQPPAAMARPPSPLPVYPQQAPGQLRPAPPVKPLPVLKPKQVIKPTCAPPLPPVKPGARGAQPGPTQALPAPSPGNGQPLPAPRRAPACWAPPRRAPRPRRRCRPAPSAASTLPLGRRKRHLARDFSDSVTLAEVVKLFRPRLVDLHNCVPTCSSGQKRSNWNVLNRSVLHKLGLSVSEEEIRKVVVNTPGAVEPILCAVRDKVEASEDPPGMAAHVGTAEWLWPLLCWDTGSLPDDESKTSNCPAREPWHHLDPALLQRLLEEKERALAVLQETVKVLQMKVARLEHLVKLKDQRIGALTQQGDQPPGRGTPGPEGPLPLSTGLRPRAHLELP